MKVLLGKTGGILFVAVWYGAAVVRWVLEIIGCATVPEDAQVAEGLLRSFFLWLLSIPWWIPIGIAFATTIALIWFSWGVSRPEKPREEQRSVSEKRKLIPAKLRREYADFVLTKIQEGRRPCVVLLSKLARELSQSNDKMRRYVGWGIGAGPIREEEQAWDALKEALTDAKTLEELEEHFSVYYQLFLSVGIWILHAAIALDRLDELRATKEFQAASMARNQVVSDVRDFVALKPRLRKFTVES